jgi:hypothetical protein
MVTRNKERSAMLARNAYLPVAPRIAARWGALSALLGGTLGVAYSVAYTLAINSGTPDGPAWWNPRFFEIHFVGTLLAVLGMFGLYGALVVRSGRPDRFALAGAAFGVLSVASVLANHVFNIAIISGWLRPSVGSYSWWLMNMQLVFDALGMGACAVGLSLLGVSAFRTRLFGRLSALPFVVAALWPASIALLILMNTSGIHWMHYVSWLSGTLPFLGAAFSGWVLLRNYPADHR